MNDFGGYIILRYARLGTKWPNWVSDGRDRRTHGLTTLNETKSEGGGVGY